MTLVVDKEKTPRSGRKEHNMDVGEIGAALIVILLIYWTVKANKDMDPEFDYGGEWWFRGQPRSPEQMAHDAAIKEEERIDAIKAPLRKEVLLLQQEANESKAIQRRDELEAELRILKEDQSALFSEGSGLKPEFDDITPEEWDQATADGVDIYSDEYHALQEKIDPKRKEANALEIKIESARFYFE